MSNCLFKFNINPLTRIYRASWSKQALRITLVYAKCRSSTVFAKVYGMVSRCISYIRNDLPLLNFLLASGIFHGSLKYASASPPDDMLDGPQLRTYQELQSLDKVSLQPDAQLLPLSMGMTEFHFILLYSDRVVAVRRLDYKIIYEELLPLVCVYYLLCGMSCSRLYFIRNPPKKFVASRLIVCGRRIGYIQTHPYLSLR